MYYHNFRQKLLLCLSLFFLTACGGLYIDVETQSSDDIKEEFELIPSQTPTKIPIDTPIPEASPTSEWSQYWVEVQDPYHNIRFTMPCFWLSRFPLEDPTGSGAFSYPIKNYPDEFVFNFPRSAIPPEIGAIKIDMSFLSGADMRNLPPGTSQVDFVNALYSSDSESKLVSTQDVEINGQHALYVTTESIFGPGNFYLFTVTEDLFLAFGTASEHIDDPDVLGILHSLALSPEINVQTPEHKPGPPPIGLAAPCIPGYEQAVVPTVDIPEGNTSCGLSSFAELEPLVNAVQQRLMDRNYGSLNYDHFINDPFIIGYWGGEGSTLTPMEMLTQLANNLLPSTEAALTFTTDRTVFPPLGGRSAEELFGPNVKVAQVVYSEGWGVDGLGAALLYFAQDQCSGYYWHGLGYSSQHFDK